MTDVGWMIATIVLVYFGTAFGSRTVDKQKAKAKSKGKKK